MLSFDPAYFSFLMIESNNFVIACNRWGMVPTQILPLIALKNHWSLEVFLKLYSVSFILVYYLIFLSCTIVLKNYRAGLALLLTLCLGFRWVFYYPTMELFMAIAFSILLWAVIAPALPYSSGIKKWIATIISILLVFTISYSHHLAFFCIIYAVLLEIIINKRWKDIHLWIVFFFTLGWFFIRVKFLTTTTYEVAKMEGQEGIFNYLPDFFTLESWIHFKTFFLSSLKSLSATFLFCLIVMAMRRQWLMMAYFILFVSGYSVLYILSFGGGVDELFFQSYTTPFGFFAGVTLMYLIGDKFPRILVLAMVSVLLFVNVKGIYKAHFIQTERINYFERLCEYGRKSSAKKFILSTTNIPNNILFHHQFMPFETLLYSSLQSPDSALTFYSADNIHELDSLFAEKNPFFGLPWYPLRYQLSTFNRNYYRLPSSNYIKINTSQTDSSFHESVFNNQNISLTPLENEFHSNVYNFIIIPIKIINTSGHILHSIPDGDHPVFLSYHLSDQNGALISSDNTRTPLEVDVRDEYIQGLMVYLPPQKGTYIVEVDFVTEGLRWWNATARFNLIVE